MLAGGYLHAAETNETNETNGMQGVSAGRGEKKRKKEKEMKPSGRSRKHGDRQHGDRQLMHFSMRGLECQPQSFLNAFKRSNSLSL